MALDENLYRSQRWSHAEARAELGRIERDPEIRAAFMNKNDRRHDAIVKQRSWLYEILTDTPAPPNSTPSPLPKTNGPLTRLAAAQKDPAFTNRLDQRHGEVLEQVHAIYRELYPGGAS